LPPCAFCDIIADLPVGALYQASMPRQFASRLYGCPGGEIGRRRGLKIPRRKACRFDSGPGHQQVSKQDPSFTINPDSARLSGFFVACRCPSFSIDSGGTSRSVYMVNITSCRNIRERTYAGWFRYRRSRLYVQFDVCKSPSTQTRILETSSNAGSRLSGCGL
jgi:hypothetical protein